MTPTSLGQHYLDTAVTVLRAQKTLAERALAQLTPADFHATLDPEANSVAVIVKHMAGNLHSRWRDFLTSDGEKPDRQRDAEFIDDRDDTESLMAAWASGWVTLFAALDGLTPDDLLTTVTIRGQEHTVLEAVERQTAHYAQHAGQIVLLAKHLKGSDWQTLSVARGASEAFSPEKKES